MDGYRVGIEEMGRLVDNLTTAAERITDANESFAEAEPSALGSEVIDAAARAFQESWEHGTGELAEVTGKVTEALRATQESYARLEEEVASLLPTEDAAGPSPSPGSGIESKLEGGP